MSPKRELQAFPLFKEASDASLTALVSASTTRVLHEGDWLWRSGDAAEHTTFIRRGLVQVARSLPNGEQATLGLFGPRENVGLIAVLGGERYPADALALTDDVELLRIPAHVLKTAMETDAGLSRGSTMVIARGAKILRAKIDMLTAGEVPQRLATLFIHLAERFGDEDGGGKVLVPLTLSRRTLARLVGVRDETVIRVMTRWEREGFVSTDESGFTIHDPHRLHGEAGLEATPP